MKDRISSGMKTAIRHVKARAIIRIFLILEEDDKKIDTNAALKRTDIYSRL